MNYLFIDTCTQNLIISIVSNGKVVTYFNKQINQGMSNYILPEIERQFKQANLKPSDINTIFASNGPGSFTGIRVGLTIAKVFAWSLNIKVVPVSSLEVMSSSFDENVLALIDARRDYVFAGGYDKNLNNIYKDKYILFNSLPKEGYKIVSYDNFENKFNPEINILKVIEKHKNDNGINPHALNPNYLKQTEAEENLNK